MPNYLISTGKSSGDTQALNLTRFVCPMGYIDMQPTEVLTQLIARNRYALSNLYVRVSANTINDITTVRSRKQTPPGAAVNGNQSVSIPATTTGAFTDPVNADSLIEGDLFCTQSVTPNAGVSITYTIISYLLSTAYTKPILAITGSSTTAASATVFYYIAGRLSATGTEIFTYYRFRVPATLSNLRAYVSANTVTAISTLRTRVNGNNGNQSLSIPATTTGDFEDITNTDIITIGQNVNLQLVAGATGVSLTVRSIQVESHSAGRQTAVTKPGTTSLAFGTTAYITIEGDSQDFNAVEGSIQITARFPFVAKNMYVNIRTNTLDASATFRLRKSSGAGGNSNLVVTVGAGLTGQFEDTVNTDVLVATDLLDWQAVTGGTVGNIDIACIGFEQSIPPIVSKVSNDASKLALVGIV